MISTNALYVPGIYLSMLEILTLSTLIAPCEEGSVILILEKKKPRHREVR